MRKALALALVMLMGICLVGNAMATPEEDECVAKCQAAAKLIKEKGLEAAVAEINKKDGPFVSPNTFVILFDFTGVVKAHGMKPENIGKNKLEDKDSKGKAYYKEYVELAKAKGNGWVEHMWMSPEKKDLAKKTYVLRVEGQDLAVAAGTLVK